MKKFSSSIENLFIKKRDFHYVQETLNGSTQAFSKLVANYYKRIFAIGMRFFHNETDSEDFVQNVFMKAYEKLGTFKGESLFSTWLTRIAITSAINQKTRTKECESLSFEEQIPYKARTPEEDLVHEATIKAVQNSLGELPQKYAECIKLYFFNGMSYDEISSATGIPLNTIKSNIFRAKKILGEKLKEFY